MIDIPHAIRAMQQANQAQELNQLKMMQARQAFPIQQQLQQLKLMQAQQAFPIQQQLQQLKLQQAQQNLAMGEQEQQAQQAQAQRAQAVMLGNLAEQALNIEDEDVRNTFILGAAQKAGVPLDDPSQVTDDDLQQMVAARNVIQPPTTSKVGRYQQTVVGDKVHVLDSATGQVQIRNLGADVVRPPGMSNEDYSIYKTLDKKTQAALIKKQLDPKTKAEQEERQKKIKSGQDLQRTALDLIDSISGSNKIADVLGGVEGRIDFRLDLEEADLIADISELSDILLSGKLDLMSGVLTDKDMEVLRRVASGGLNRVASTSRFTTRLKSIRDAFEGKLEEESDLPEFPEGGASIGDEKAKRLEQLRSELGL